MRGRHLFLAASLVLAGAGAEAADPFPGGVFGQQDGCRYARTGESSGADDFLLLDREAITTAVAVCAIRSAAMTGPDAAKLVLACESEGESGDDEPATAFRRNDAWTVRLGDGTVFGPARRCP